MMQAVKGWQSVVANADQEKAEAKKVYEETLKRVDKDSAEARQKLKKLEPILASL